MLSDGSWFSHWEKSSMWHSRRMSADQPTVLSFEGCLHLLLDPVGSNNIDAPILDRLEILHCPLLALLSTPAMCGSAMGSRRRSPDSASDWARKHGKRSAGDVAMAAGSCRCLLMPNNGPLAAG
jgi:hypothetical protein